MVTEQKQTRIDIGKADPKAYEVMLLLERYIKESGISKNLYELIKVRASQINGCAYCVNMHTRDARKLGETEQRLYTLSVWRDTQFFTEEDRAVLAFTEEVTRIGQTQNVSDDVYNELTKHYDDKRIAQLTMAVITINAWNRIGVTMQMFPD
jgi:AhpD family alkylhydroperoxidase